jgi:hypothetical protein
VDADEQLFSETVRGCCRAFVAPRALPG